MKANNTKTVVFVTGAFVSHNGWDQWRTYFESKGYTTYAPAWPYKDAPAAERSRPAPVRRPDRDEIAAPRRHAGPTAHARPAGRLRHDPERHHAANASAG